MAGGFLAPPFLAAAAGEQLAFRLAAELVGQDWRQEHHRHEAERQQQMQDAQSDLEKHLSPRVERQSKFKFAG